VFQSENLHPDLAIAFLKLLWPDFMIKEECIFLKEEFTVERYEEITSAVAEKQDIEYWMNLLNINETINCDSSELSFFFAEQLSELWRAKLAVCFPGKEFQVKVICDGDDSDAEVYLSFQQFSSN
jgi:hypothetical protein